MFSFTITHKDSKSNARGGIIKTPHGTLQTPALTPVATKAAIKGLTVEQLEEIGFEALLANTYHLYLQPGVDIVAKQGKLHTFMNWQKPIFTDSGGFQVFSLNNKLCTVNENSVTFRSHIDSSTHIFTPEKSMQAQRKLGADMIFAFDQCLDINADRHTTELSMQRTHRWEERSLNEFTKLNKDKSQALYGIAQGGRFIDLREQSAQFIASLPFDGLAIGSIFGDPKVESKKLVAACVKHFPEHKPRHLLGIGAVEDIFTYVEQGMDTFDCVLPTRLARIGYIFIRPESGGSMKNKYRYHLTQSKWKKSSEPLDKNCSCRVCQNYTKAYIHHLYKAKELLFYTLTTYHNLYFFQMLFREIRESIVKGKFKELKKKWVR